MEKPGKIVSFGEVLIDMLAQPQANADAPRTFQQFAGGAPANVAVAVARLGGNSHFVGMLGADMFGDFLFHSLQAAGVATDGVQRTDQARTALAFVALDAQGERSFSFYRPPSADMLFRAEDFDRIGLDGVRLFHCCSICMTGEAIAQTSFEGMRRARAAGAVVSFDMNLRPMLWPQGEDPAPRLWQALALADVVKLSREEFDWLRNAANSDGAAVIERLWQGNAQLLLVTDGDHPLRWYTRVDEGEVPAFRVRAQDTTAAGDAFVGGLLFQLAQWLEGATLDAFCRDRTALERSLRFAAGVGALAVTRKGAFAAMPTLDEVQALIRVQS